MQNTSNKFLPQIVSLLWLYAISAVAYGETMEWRQYNTHDEATAVLKAQSQRIQENPGQAEPYIIRGNAYFELRDFESAITDFSKALKIDDKADLAYFGRGMALGRAGAIDEGIADLDIFIVRHPDSSVAHTKRGIRYLWKGDSDKAEQDLMRAIELDPRNAEAQDDLGVIKAQRGEYSNAIRHFSTTVSIDPSYQKGFHNLAMAYYLTDRNQAALASVNTALDLSPESKNSLKLKGSILKSMGKHEAAAEAFETAEFLPEGGGSEMQAVK